MKMQEMIDAMISGKIPPAPVAQLVGFHLKSCANGISTMTIKTTPRHYNPMGTLHGGVLCDIADAAMGIAFASTLDDGESFTTIDLQITYLRPVWEADLTATGKVVKRGRSIGYTECEIVDENGRLIAKASSNCMVLRGDDAKGR